MIIIFLGGIGSGKTLSIVKEIVDTNQYALTNFKLKKITDYHRIKISDIIIAPKEKGEKYSVNWKFWEKTRKEHKNYSIFMDEIHNVIHSRRAMSNVNIQMSKWISQIRKMLSDNPKNHLYLISQTIRKIDVDFRELAQCIVTCQKKIYKKKVYIFQRWYNGLDAFEYGKPTLKIRFMANPYFKYYDTTDLVTFSDAEEYV